NSGTMAIANSTVSGNQAVAGLGTFYEKLGAGDAEGGGIWNQNTMNISGCIISDNQALGSPVLTVAGGHGFGGVIFTFGGSVTITGSTIFGNEAMGGRYLSERFDGTNGSNGSNGANGTGANGSAGG